MQGFQYLHYKTSNTRGVINLEVSLSLDMKSSNTQKNHHQRSLDVQSTYGCGLGGGRTAATGFKIVYAKKRVTNSGEEGANYSFSTPLSTHLSLCG